MKKLIHWFETVDGVTLVYWFFGLGFAIGIALI